jgi:LCP family protein required for cell wall assembly
MLIPGWGQLVTNRTALGKTLVFITGLVAIAVLTTFLFVEPVELAAWVADPDVLLAIVALNLLFAVMRLFSTGHAWLAGGGHRWFAGVFLAAIVGIPHVAIAWAGLETRDSLLKVFPESTLAAPAPTTTTTPSTTTTTLDLSPIVTTPGQYTADVIDVEKTTGWRPFGEDRLNVLLLGGDAGPGRGGLRTDTMIVASVDPISGDAALIGLPRNFGQVTFTDGTVVPVRRLNHVYEWGRSHPDAFSGPDPGASATRNVVENITGLEIDYHMLVDLTGFADLVDAFGGVRMHIPETVGGPLYDPVSGGYEMIEIPAGSQRLDGGHALAYARARYGSSDYARMGRQRCILAAMARDADLLGLATRLPDILAVVETNLSTDMPVELVPELIRLAPRIAGSQIRVVGFDATWRVGTTADGHAIPDVDRIRATVRQTIEDPAAATDSGVTTAGAACG